MKLSYRDKVILLTFSIILLLAVGIFVFIKPLKEDIKIETTKRNSAQVEKDKVDDKRKELPNLEQSISRVYVDASAIAELFSDLKEDYELDQYIQEKLNNNNVFVNEELLLGEAELANITYYYYAPTVLDYSLKTYADLNGNYNERDKKITAKSDHLGQKTPETIPVMRIAFNFYCAKKENIYSFIDEIGTEDGRVIITALEIDDQENVIKLLEENDIPVTPELSVEATMGTVSIEIYLVENVDKPADITISP